MDDLRKTYGKNTDKMQASSRQHVINPAENSRKIDRIVLLSERIFILVAMLVTSAGFYVFGRSMASQYIDVEFVCIAIGVLCAITAAFVTDLAFRNFLEEVVYEPLAAMHPYTRRMDTPTYFVVLKWAKWAILTTVVIVLFMADYYSVALTRGPLGSEAKQEATADIAAATAAVSSQYSGAAAPLAQQIKTLKADIAAAERRTEANNASLASLIANGNGWAKNEMAKRKAKATASLKKELDATQAAYTAALSGQVAAVNSTTAALASRNAQVEADNLTKRASIEAMYFGAGILFKGLTVLFRIFLVISFLAKSPTLDANGDGIVDGRDVTAAAGGGSPENF